MNLGFPEMLFIFVLALLIFGPKKLPEIARQIGKALAEFKRASNEFQWHLQEEVRKLEHEADIKNPVVPDATASVVAVRPRLSQPGNPILPDVRPPEVQPAKVNAPDLSSHNATT